MAKMLNRIWQRHHMPPSTFRALSAGEQAFLIASELEAMESEENFLQNMGGE